MYRKSEQGLSRQQEVRFFVTTLEHQLRNSVLYEPVGFVGKTNEIVFAAVVKSFDRDQITEQLVTIKYFLKDNSLFREVEPLSEEDRKQKKREEVLGPLQNFSFHYAFLDKESKEISWREEWVWADQKAIPRAIRIEGQFQNPDKNNLSSKAVDFSVPIVVFQGAWGNEKSEKTEGDATL